MPLEEYIPRTSDPTNAELCMIGSSIPALLAEFATARERRLPWEAVWRDCYAYALPMRGHGLDQSFRPGANHAERLFDGTAPDAVEQLAASLLAELTPPWSRWFGLRPGHDVDPLDADALAAVLDAAALRLQGHFERSNFAVEIHQCFLDLVTTGTATLLFEEAPIGSASAFQFTAIPAAEIYIDGDANGAIRRHFRSTTVTLAQLRARFGGCRQLDEIRLPQDESRSTGLELIEAVTSIGTRFRYQAILPPQKGFLETPLVLSEGVFEQSPFLTFRWMKGTSELYGRSPVMTALPDIKTANKVVELVLKNASIAVTGIWLAEDDGVLNPANIRLAPGSIIPKAVGSAGLTPLQAPGRFDVSELVLSDLRTRIRHTLLADRLAPINDRRMTATEVLERSAEMTRLLGAIYGRLQTELLTPLLQRSLAILRRRGEVPAVVLDGTIAEILYRSPLARIQAREEVRNVILWLETVAKFGGNPGQFADLGETASWLAETLGVPNSLVNRPALLLDEDHDG